MKAKDMAKILSEAGDDPDKRKEAIKTVFFQHNKDLHELVKVRNPQSIEAMVSIVKEIDNKWQAMCRMAPGFCNPMGYREVLKADHNLLYEVAFNDYIKKHQELESAMNALRISALRSIFGGRGD